jgi:uncharacterized protein YkvS
MNQKITTSRDPEKMVVVNGNILITQMLQFQLITAVVEMVGEEMVVVEITQMNNIKFLHQIHIVL